MKIQRGKTALITHKKGIALLTVVMVLTSMLAMGTVFITETRLELIRAVNYARLGQAELFAMEGVNRSVAELMYDVWGVNEERAFVCSPEWGQLSRGFHVEGMQMAAAYRYKGSGGEQIVAPRSIYRRSRSDLTATIDGKTFNIQTDYRWIDKEQYYKDINKGIMDPVGLQSGGYYWDEFLPESTDNSDAFELGLILNHGAATDRNFYNDAKPFGGRWSSGRYWPDADFRSKRLPWDYIDTRIVPDSFYHIFRFDLVDPTDFCVRGTGVSVVGKEGDPKQPMGDVRNNPDFRATHLEFARNAGWHVQDPWGGAVNLNQVNNNYKWEQYYNWRAYGTVPVLTQHHLKESKWINIYDPSGTRIIGRYAVTVSPDCGSANPNYMYDHAMKKYTYWTFGNIRPSATYLGALDGAFNPHGLPIAVGGKTTVEMPDVYGYDPNTPPNLIKGKTVLDDPAPDMVPWYYKMSTRFAQHKSLHGLMTSRSELSMLIRKWGFDPNLESSDELKNDAVIISSLCAPSSYEYLLGPHWDEDRFILDLSSKGCLLPSVAAIDKRRAFMAVLNDLKYYWGPDGRTGISDSGYDAFDPNYCRWTPYHEIDPNSATPKTAWDARARRAKGMLLSWFINASESFGWIGEARPTCYVADVNTKEIYNKVPKTAFDNNPYLETAHVAWTGFRVNEAGRFTPQHPTRDENANGDGSLGGEGQPVGFDGTKEYYFIEIVPGSSLTNVGSYGNVPIRIPQKYKIFVDNTDILTLPETRIVGRTTDLNRDGISLNYPDVDGAWSMYHWSGAPWQMKDQPIVVAPSNASNPAGKANLPLVCMLYTNRDMYTYGKPFHYLVIYFPTTMDGKTITIVDGNSVLERVELPDRLSKLKAGQSYSAMVHTNTSKPNCWQVTAATPAWRVKFHDGYKERWIDGINENMYPQSWPSYRIDIYGISKRVSKYISPGAGLYERKPSRVAMGRFIQLGMVSGAYGEESSFYLTPFALMPEFSWDEVVTNPAMSVSLDGDMLYDPYGDKMSTAPVNPVLLRTYMLHHYFDGDLVTWHDLCRNAPIDRVVGRGSFDEPKFGWSGPPLNQHTEWSMFDGVDNDYDGVIDALTSDPILPNGRPGYYVSDRKAIGRLNINESSHPAANFYASTVNSWNKMVFIGRKPLKGFNSVGEIPTRGNYYGRDDTPYDRQVWYENMFADCSTDTPPHHDPKPEVSSNYVFMNLEMKDITHQGFAGNSPVYTIYITAQTIHQDTANNYILTPTGEIKVRATVERTWDGKVNFLEFTWIPSDISLPIGQ